MAIVAKKRAAGVPLIWRPMADDVESRTVSNIAFCALPATDQTDSRERYLRREFKQSDRLQVELGSHFFS